MIPQSRRPPHDEDLPEWAQAAIERHAANRARRAALQAARIAGLETRHALKTTHERTAVTHTDRDLAQATINEIRQDQDRIIRALASPNLDPAERLRLVDEGTALHDRMVRALGLDPMDRGEDA